MLCVVFLSDIMLDVAMLSVVEHPETGVAVKQHQTYIILSTAVLLAC